MAVTKSKPSKVSKSEAVKPAKSEAETVTKDGVLPRNHFVVVVAIATGHDTTEKAAGVAHRIGATLATAYTMTDSVVKLLEREGLITVANTKPRGHAELTLTDAGWAALAKTREFYATDKF